MGQQIEQLARFVAETTLEQIPPAVRQYAKLIVRINQSTEGAGATGI